MPLLISRYAIKHPSPSVKARHDKSPYIRGFKGLILLEFLLKNLQQEITLPTRNPKFFIGFLLAVFYIERRICSRHQKKKNGIEVTTGTFQVYETSQLKFCLLIKPAKSKFCLFNMQTKFNVLISR